LVGWSRNFRATQPIQATRHRRLDHRCPPPCPPPISPPTPPSPHAPLSRHFPRLCLRWSRTCWAQRITSMGRCHNLATPQPQTLPSPTAAREQKMVPAPILPTTNNPFLILWQSENPVMVQAPIPPTTDNLTWQSDEDRESDQLNIRRWTELLLLELRIRHLT